MPSPGNPVPPGAYGAGSAPPSPPPPVPAPKSSKAPPSANARAAELFKKFPAWKKYWGNIVNAAYRYKVDPLELLSLFIFENGKANPKATSSAGAVGLAQIYDASVNKNLNPTQYDTFIQEWANGDPRITKQMKENPAFSIAYAAWRMGGTRGNYGSLDEWYRSPGYNPGFKGDSRGPGPSIYVGKYQPTVPQTPAQSAAGSIDVAGATDALTSVWAVRKKDGTVAFVKTAEPPKNTIKSFGQPVDRSGFLKAQQYYNDIYQSYVGKNAPPEAIAHILNSGLSDSGLAMRLSKAPAFRNGTLYQARAGSIVQYAKGMFGGNWKVDGELVRKAIVGNWNEGTLVDNLKKRPEYLQGPEFKKDQAGKLNVYMSIMGRPDAQAQTTIKEVALSGWSDDQFAAYLRGHPAYKYSPELQTKQLAFAEAMGLITGRQATLKPGDMPTGQPFPQIGGQPPNSPRIPGAPGLNASNNLTVGGLGG